MKRERYALPNETEQFVMLALVRLGQAAYGVPIRDEIVARGGRAVSIAAVYAALDRLERAGYVEAWMSAPLPERGGRARRHYAVTPEGAAALRAARASLMRMWEGIEPIPTGRR